MRRLGLSFFALALVACSPAQEGGTTKSKRDLSFPHGGDGFIDFIDMARNTTSCVGGGTVCSSANPGACDRGTVTCDGPLAMCTPDSALQDCYTGLGGTQNVGVCKAGTQSCIGILGPCEGEVLPAAKEDCFNDLDDDCDAKVNNSCPESVGVGLSGTLPTPLGANIAGDMMVTARCPTDAFVTEFDMDLRNYPPYTFSLVSFDLHCSTATLTRTSSSYTLGVQAVMPKPYVSFQHPNVAAPQGAKVNYKCSGSGLRALTEVTGKWDAGGGYFGMINYCGLATAAPQADNTLKFTLAKQSTALGYVYPLAGTSEGWVCPAGQVIVGFTGMLSTTSIDKMAPICAPLVAKYKL